MANCTNCGHKLEPTDPWCPNCGWKIEAKKEQASGKPKTIAELKEYCRARSMPLDRMRFQIGKDYKGAKAFGIFQDPKTGNFIVYKNKADGNRAVRYQGPDEAFAVSELYERLREEIKNQYTKGNIKKKDAKNQKKQKLQESYHASHGKKDGGTPKIAPATKSNLAGSRPSTPYSMVEQPDTVWSRILGFLDNLWFNITFEIGWLWDELTSLSPSDIAARIIMVIGVAWFGLAGIFFVMDLIVGTPDRGYYSYDDGYYYYLDDDWYAYDEGTSEWEETSVPGELSANYGDYYEGTDYVTALGAAESAVSSAAANGDGNAATQVETTTQAAANTSEAETGGEDAAPFSNFEETEYYSYWMTKPLDADDYDYDDDDSSWDFSDWDSDDTDWDSDW